MLTLTVPEMTVLVGGMRVLSANAGKSKQGVFTSKLGALSNYFFIKLVDMSTIGRSHPSLKGFMKVLAEDRWDQMDGCPGRPDFRVDLARFLQALATKLLFLRQL